MVADISIEIGGVKLRSPLIVSSGQHGRDGSTMKEISRHGVGGVTTKTIGLSPDPDPLPCFVTTKGGFINAVLGSVLPAEDWFAREIRVAKEGEAKVVANLKGPTPEATAQLAQRAEEAGADFIEIPSSCPHMPEIIEAMHPGRRFPRPDIGNPMPWAEGIAAVRRAVSIPVIAKLSATFSSNVVTWARAAEEAGADAVSAADALGPVLAIDIETGQPKLGGPRGVGGLTGGALKPLALRMVLEMAQTVRIPVIGVGGVSSWQDAIEYFMAGASCVGVATQGHLRGIKSYQTIVDGISRYLTERGYSSLDDIRGLTIRKIEERREHNKQVITVPIPPTVEKAKCNGCRLCETACVYEAMKIVDGLAVVNEATCAGCGLCADVCARRAIALHYYY